jgi:tagaturonate reductase
MDNMDYLSVETYSKIDSCMNQGDTSFVLHLPEKVLQFGTGVLLRALPDFYIDAANKAGEFNGRVVMVKSTTSPIESAFQLQNGLFTHVLRGIKDGREFEELHVNASISRILHAIQEWDEVLKIAKSPDLEIIISNTTEVGIVYVEEKISGSVPSSFPAKLLAVLYQRFLHFKGDSEKGLIILPTELIDNNAEQLKTILDQLAQYNELSQDFFLWLNQANHFCNTLVDRIVPGKLNDAAQSDVEVKLGYRDELMIMSEPFGLWAIESKDSVVVSRLGFINPSIGCLLVDDVHVYKELKLRLLNATHSFCCAYALQSGFTYVREAMTDEGFNMFVRSLLGEIKSVLLLDPSISNQLIDDFAETVIDRFSNPYIDHQWKSISLHYSTKIKVRCLPLFKKALEIGGGGYEHMLTGLEAYNVFSQGELSDFLQTEVYGKE